MYERETLTRTIVYGARLVRTMDPAQPTAQAVAVRGDRIRAAGSVEELLAYPDAVYDPRFEEHVLLPGFVEAHSHAESGGVWDGVYVGYVDRVDPSGTRWPGCRSIAEVLARLQEAEARMDDPDRTLLAWGFDPIYFADQVLTAHELDRVSATRPIYVTHTSGHACTVNTRTVQVCRIGAHTDVPGVATDAAGDPTGELHEFEAMELAAPVVDGGGLAAVSHETLLRFGQDAVNTGTTTLTDLGSPYLMDDAGVDIFRGAVDEAFPARLNVFHAGAGMGPVPGTFAEAARRISALARQSTPRLRFGNVKLMLDGTLQGFTAKVRPPGYLRSDSTGMWNISPQEYREAFETFHRAGMTIHVHCNGDDATELFLDTLEAVQIAHPRPDHRHTCTHSQMTTAAQYRRMAALGACANVFANHIWAYGDQHLDITVGPDRARRNNAAATALRHGVPISLHSDTPVTPLGPLATVKHAVTRRTVSGRVMGEHERIDVAQALEAVTLGGAYMLKMDHEVGSIEAGKFADLAVLAEDPLAVDPLDIGDIHVLGTMVGGTFHPSNIGSA